MEQLIDESRTPWERFWRGVFRRIAHWYLASLVIGIVVSPLVIAKQQILAPIGIVIGPPLLLLTSIALVSGFLMFPTAAIGGWIESPFVWLTEQCICLCSWIVRYADRVPAGHCFVGTLPNWWVGIAYGLLVVGFLRPFVSGLAERLRSRTLFWIALGWCGLGYWATGYRVVPDEVRISFIAVGHGGCTVMELPDGKVLLYDAGSLGGPEVVRRRIAPFLWSRGIRRIDEVFLSHADLDHFNGLPALIQRFPIGMVTTTPSFFQKRHPGVIRVESLLAEQRIPHRVTKAGAHWTSGELEIHVLHPPEDAPPGPDENPRSMVLLIQHARSSILLTGDLSGAGLSQFLERPRCADVLMAPHHGSTTSNIPRLRDAVLPRLVIVCEELREEPTLGEKVYLDRRIPLWSTARHGTITLHSHTSGLTAVSYRTGERLVVPDR